MSHLLFNLSKTSQTISTLSPGSLCLGQWKLQPIRTFTNSDNSIIESSTLTRLKRLPRQLQKPKLILNMSVGHGALGAKGISKALELPLTVNDEEGWKKAESFVEKSMREKWKGILVQLVLKYAKKCTDDASDSDEEKPDKYKGKKVHLHLL